MHAPGPVPRQRRSRQVFETTELDQIVPNLQFADNAPLAADNSQLICVRKSR